MFTTELSIRERFERGTSHLTVNEASGRANRQVAGDRRTHPAVDLSPRRGRLRTREQARSRPLIEIWSVTKPYAAEADQLIFMAQRRRT